MTAQEAEALVAGEKIVYWDGRIATVTIPSSTPPVGEVAVTFDAETQNPKPVCYILSKDFMRAEPA